MDIRAKISELNSIISKARHHIIQLRSNCPHKEGYYVYGGDSGNWCPSDDCYWKNFTCLDCGKEWTEYSELPGGRRNPNYHQNPIGDWNEKRLM